MMTTETSAADEFAQESTADANVEALEARTPTHRSVTLILAVVWLVVIFLAAVFADWLPLHSPTEGIADPRVPPFHDWSVPLGTDRLGRDLLSRVIYGARTALAAGLVSTAISLVVGMTIGIVSGYRRGAVDGASGIFTDTLLAVPPLVLLMALAATLQPSMTTLIVGLSIVALPTFIRLARATTLRITAQPYVTAAQAIGTKDRHIMLREIGPGVLQALLAYAMVIAGVLIVVESSLSYLGLGIPPPSPSWGSMIADSQQELQSDPHLVFVPGAVLFVTVFALNIVGERSTSRRSGTRA